jgi:anti-sigma B factor antagonist
MALDVSSQRVGDVLVVRLSGDLDRSADEPLSALEEEISGVSGVVLDFAPTGFIASSGLALLVRLVRTAGATGAAVAGIGLDDHYRHVFEITRLDSVIGLADDEQAALAAVSGGTK